MTYPTQFESSYALAELPWFELRDGRLYRDPELGVAIDVHTHLAQSFFKKDSVDLRACPRPAEHYLPLDARLNLDDYANLNFTPEHMKALKRDLGLGGVFGKAGMRDTHTAPNLMSDMADLGIVASVLLPIDMPRISRNAEAYLEIADECPPLVGFGSVHPFEKGFAARLERQKAAGALGIKIHPGVQMLRPDHKRAMDVYRVCGELDLPVFWHCGPVEIESRWGRYCSQVRHYVKAVKECSDTTFVLGHSGALQMDQGLELMQDHDNVWAEIASQGVTNVRRLVENAPIERLMFGTDWPFYHQGAGLAKILMATEGEPTKRAMVMRQNAQRLLGIEDLPGTVA
jgi:predicted TIM-barrel fold metal-dependent hydrolase